MYPPPPPMSDSPPSKNPYKTSSAPLRASSKRVPPPPPTSLERAALSQMPSPKGNPDGLALFGAVAKGFATWAECASGTTVAGRVARDGAWNGRFALSLSVLSGRGATRPGTKRACFEGFCECWIFGCSIPAGSRSRNSRTGHRRPGGGDDRVQPLSVDVRAVLKVPGAR
jgi:hypothetical protein